ncbi:MAG: 2,3,4,5-tetrahydropyridine-2,6-dicarboxylate N-succinyltransferase, partial [Terriglobales bacterium]
MSVADLAAAIAAFAAMNDLTPVRAEALAAFAALRQQLNQGTARAALPRGADWETQVWVKQGILLGFRLGALQA